MKHKIIQDFHLMSPDKNIITLKSGTIIEDYIYRKGSSNEINVGKDAVERNPQYFEIWDWKSELTAFLKSSKIPQPSVLSKKIQPFIQDMFISGQSNTQTLEVQVDNPEHLKEIELLKRKLKEKDIEISELNSKLERKESRTNREIEEREKDLLFLKEQLDKRKIMLEDLDYEIENRSKEVKNREFEILTWENRVNQSMINLQEALDKINQKEQEISQPIIDESQRQNIVKVKTGWDGIYRGAH